MKKKKENINEIEYEQKTGDYTTERNKKFDWLVFIFCVVAAFAIWLFALNANDPIIEKDIDIVYKTDGVYAEKIIAEFYTVRVYGTKSTLDDLYQVEATVKESDLKGTAPLNIKITYPSGVKPVDDSKKTVKVQILVP